MYIISEFIGDFATSLMKDDHTWDAKDLLTAKNEDIHPEE